MQEQQLLKEKLNYIAESRLREGTNAGRISAIPEVNFNASIGRKCRRRAGLKRERCETRSAATVFENVIRFLVGHGYRK